MYVNNDIKYKQADLDYGQQLEKLFGITPKNCTFQVTENCNLKCTYCYQINKTHNNMDFNTAKKYIDLLLEGKAPYLLDENGEYPKGAIIEFIGGEPLLQVDLIDQICEYTINRMIDLNHPWLFRCRFSMSSNGTLYFTDKVQKLLKKYPNLISITITLDGNKQLHDSCRLFADGTGSYDIVEKAVKHYKKYYNSSLGTKLTISPENIEYLFPAVKNFIDLDFTCIHLNCIFEKGWENKHATILYNQLKLLADYLLQNNLFDKVYLSIFEEHSFYKLPDNETNNWCGGSGKMLALDWRGDYYPCIRYMPSSLGPNKKPLIIGNIDRGLGTLPEEQKIIDDLKSITRQSQSTQECLDCPINAGCAWCSGYNYQEFGTANHRATYICCMHKARALANAYFFNSAYVLYNIPNQFKLNLPEEEALKIIPQEEYNNLKMLEELAGNSERLEYENIEAYLKTKI